MAKKKDFKVNFDTEGTEITTDEEDTITMDDAIDEIDNEEQTEEIPEDWQKLIKAYDSRTFENQKDIALICDTANKVIYDRFRVNLRRPDDPFFSYYKMTAMIFVETFRAIIQQLLDRRATNATYNINIGNRINIGFSNSDNDEDEKNGNFCPYVKDIPHYTVKDDDDIKLDGHSKEYIRNWNQENMIQNPEDTLTIANRALKSLKAIDINLGSPELVFPLFVTIYESIISYLKIRRRESEDDEFMINFCNCITVDCIGQDDGVDKITIIPAIEDKLNIKSDKNGTAIYE
nr:MAG TPA: hypothetical protein [Caudoviricetes sp.]